MHPNLAKETRASARGRRLWSLVAVATLFVLSLSVRPPPVQAFPVATDDATYQVFGRVFPDPHGCLRGAPGASPWAKGSVCATQFLQFEQVIAGLTFLQKRFPNLIEVINLRERFDKDPSFAADELQSAGLPQEDLSRDKRDLYVIKVTDDRSKIPESKRRHFAYSLSIHGIERAGIEGGIRAAEDLVTWAACQRDADASPACVAEGVSPAKPKRILDAFDPPEGPTAGEVLNKGVVYFVLANPDGWHRGEATKGGVFFQRYNGNGMDVNRDWPTVGYTEEQYTPGSEPETRGYAKFLARARDGVESKKFAGAIDLHGMLNARSFSYTLLGAGQRDYRKNAITVQTAVTTFRDAEARLTWSPLVAKSPDCPGRGDPVTDDADLPMCTDQWGTVWDTINYQTTGSFGDWMDSDIGLDAVGIDNEMAYSHLTFNNVFDPQIEQLHVDGNKGLIYAQIAALLNEQPASYTPRGRIAYVYDPARTAELGGRATSPLSKLPAQATVEHVAANGTDAIPFNVKGPADGVANGGMTIEVTNANVRGISPNAMATVILDYCGPPEHAGDPQECREVARYFNQSGIYLQAGARIDLNDPKPGPYRIRGDQSRLAPGRYTISFSRFDPIPAAEKQPYDVSRMDFFDHLNRYAARGKALTPLRVSDILADRSVLDGFDTLVVADAFMPGFASSGAASSSARATDAAAGRLPRYDGAHRRAYTAALRAFASRGGALVLTDGALSGLPLLQPAIPATAVRRGYFYAGWMDFDDGTGSTYAKHRLANGVNKPGASEGVARIDGVLYDNRHQTYEPGPLGYFISPTGAGNASCTSDRCDSPNWIVKQDVWKRAGGTVAALTFARRKERQQGTVAPGDAGVSLGEIRLGKGVIRIAGALLPEPTKANYHPLGLRSYALTYTGYQVFENLVDHVAASRPAPRVLPIKRRAPLPATGGASYPFTAAVALALAMAIVAAIRRARRTL